MSGAPQLTCVIAAHQSSPYLEACVQSLLAQTAPCTVKIHTSTPHPHIEEIARRHQLTLVVSPHRSANIGQDWNAALGAAPADGLVALCHQDDVYQPEFAAAALALHTAAPDMLMSFSAPAELTSQGERQGTLNLRIKSLMVRCAFGPGNVRHGRWLRWPLLSLGNPVNCPSVVFNKTLLGEFRFEETLRSNLDWDAWDRILRMDGRIGYIPRRLVLHRIHAASATSIGMGNAVRETEDLMMFSRYWPQWLARLLMIPYRLSYKSNWDT